MICSCCTLLPVFIAGFYSYKNLLCGYYRKIETGWWSMWSNDGGMIKTPIKNLTSMFCFCESNEKRMNSTRSKFADASISRLIEDRGRSEVQPSYRLSKVRKTCAAFETLTWRKYETKCRSLKRFFFLFLFSRGKGKENFKLCMCCLKIHTQYFYTIVTYDTPNPR